MSWKHINDKKRRKRIRVDAGQDPEEQKEIMREFRETMGFPPSDTESTWRTEDLYKVGYKEWGTVIGHGKFDGFLDVFKMLFPDEFSKVELWRLKSRLKVVTFVTPSGRPNYEVVYPALKAFWNAWAGHLSRAPTLNDIYSITKPWLQNEVPKFMPDFPFSALFSNTTVSPYTKGDIYHTAGRRSNKMTKKWEWSDKPLTKHEEAIVIRYPDTFGKFYADRVVTGFLKQRNMDIYSFCKDLYRFFLCRGEDGKFKKSEWNDFVFDMSRLHSRHAKDLGWGDEMSRRWMTEIALPWLGIDATDFPHGSSDEVIQKCYDTSQEMLMDIPKYHRFMSQTFNDPSCKYGMGHICMSLWPDYDWDDLQFGAVLMGEQRAIRILRDTFGVVLHQYKMPMRNGRIAKFSDTKMPMRIDGFIEDYGVAVEIQGGHHYIGRDQNREEREWVADLKRTQWCDAAKKRAVKRQGHHMVYIPIYKNPFPVKGVHGKLPRWNWKLTTEESPKKDAVGLAELFEMQGAVGAARKIRGIVA